MFLGEVVLLLPVAGLTVDAPGFTTPDLVVPVLGLIDAAPLLRPLAFALLKSLVVVPVLLAAGKLVPGIVAAAANVTLVAIKTGNTAKIIAFFIVD